MGRTSEKRHPAMPSLPSLILGWGVFEKNRVFNASLETGLALNTRFCYVEKWKTLDFENHKKGIIKKRIAKILTSPTIKIWAR